MARISLVDATAAVLAAIDEPPGTSNIFDSISITNRQLNDLLAKISGQSALHPVHLSYSAGDRGLCSDPTASTSGRSKP